MRVRQTSNNLTANRAAPSDALAGTRTRGNTGIAPNAGSATRTANAGQTTGLKSPGTHPTADRLDPKARAEQQSQRMVAHAGTPQRTGLASGFGHTGTQRGVQTPPTVPRKQVAGLSQDAHIDAPGPKDTNAKMTTGNMQGMQTALDAIQAQGLGGATDVGTPSMSAEGRAKSGMDAISHADPSLNVAYQQTQQGQMAILSKNGKSVGQTKLPSDPNDAKGWGMAMWTIGNKAIGASDRNLSGQAMYSQMMGGVAGGIDAHTSWSPKDEI